jgi:photosystem II stability/assembly factor-like uncharacterized protein
MSFDPFVPARIFFASTDGGLLVSSDAGDTLRESNTGFANRPFTSLATSGGALYLSGLLDLYQTNDLAQRWQDVGTGPENRNLLALSAAPDAPRTLWGARYRGLFESPDGGKTWQTRPGLPDGVRVKAVLARARGVVLAGTDQGLLRSDATGAWHRMADGPVDQLRSTGSKQIVALSPAAALVSVDDGISWQNCANPAPVLAWYGLEFDRANPDIALAATSRGLFRSVDTCRSWTAITDGLERATVQAVVFHPTRPAVFAAQGGRVFRSTDAGLSWLPLDNSDRPDLWPSSLLAIASAPQKLFALVPGRGLFSTTLPED